MNLSDPGVLSELAESMRLALGAREVERATEQIRAGDPLSPPLDILRGFVLLDSWLSALRAGTAPPEVDLMLLFAATAASIRHANGIPSSAEWLADLRRKAFLTDPELFKETLFEGEFAHFWASQAARNPDSAEFGPPLGHPDVWAWLPSEPQVRMPAECKRIRPHGEKELHLSRFADAIDKGLQDVISNTRPLKAIVWLHRTVNPGDDATALALIRTIADSGEPSAWTTRFSVDAGIQVSAAPLGVAGEFQPPGIRVSDVEAAPIFIPRAEILHTEDGIRVRMKSLLSVRSDQVRDRVGNIKDNVRTAIRQLPLANSGSTPGLVALRIRPPQDQGDLFHSDRAIRAVLAREDTPFVSLVCVFWNEGDREREPNDTDAAGPMSVRAAYSLKPYFIHNPKCALNLGWDSYNAFFGDLSRPVIRDPTDGSLKPVDPDTLAVLQDGGELPPMLRDALAKMADLPEEEGAATAYVAIASVLNDPYATGLVSLVRAGRRQFRTFMDSQHLLRTIEIRDGMPVGICTIDLRAWAAANELCWSIEWKPQDFRVGIWSPDESERLYAASAHVSQLRAI